MNVFISWSGARSQAIAGLLNDWIPNVLQSADTFMSEEDTEKGARWFEQITRHLQDSEFGIVCLTWDNRNQPWLNFEAGAIANNLGRPNVTAVLIDFEDTDLTGPLSFFQATSLDRKEMFRLVRSINTNIEEERRLTEGRLEETFDTWWPKFEERLAGIEIEAETDEERRQTRDILEEILRLTRFTADEVTLGLGGKTGARSFVADLFEHQFARQLSERERKILVLFYGLDDGEQMTDEEVGLLLGLPPEAVQEIRRGALDKLRT